MDSNDRTLVKQDVRQLATDAQLTGRTARDSRPRFPAGAMGAEGWSPPDGRLASGDQLVSAVRYLQLGFAIVPRPPNVLSVASSSGWLPIFGKHRRAQGSTFLDDRAFLTP